MSFWTTAMPDVATRHSRCAPAPSRLTTSNRLPDRAVCGTIHSPSAGKIPLSLGRDCPVKCEFCYELDHSYRETQDPPKTSDEEQTWTTGLRSGRRRIASSSRAVPLTLGSSVSMGASKLTRG